MATPVDYDPLLARLRAAGKDEKAEEVEQIRDATEASYVRSSLKMCLRVLELIERRHRESLHPEIARVMDRTMDIAAEFV